MKGFSINTLTKKKSFKSLKIIEFSSFFAFQVERPLKNTWIKTYPFRYSRKLNVRSLAKGWNYSL